MPHLPRCLPAAALLLAPPLSAQELLWDNALRSDGRNGRAVSPPNFPDIRVADDLVLKPGDPWFVTAFHAGTIEDADWIHGGVTEVFVRAHDEDRDGPVEGAGNELYNAIHALTRVATGNQYFGRSEYFHFVEGLGLSLEPGVYWIGFRHPRAEGRGTCYWLEGPGGPDGGRTSGHHFSLDAGETWMVEGHHVSFELHGHHGRLGRTVLSEVTEGAYITGGVLAVQDSDNEYYVVESHRPSRVSRPSAEVEFTALAPRRKVGEIEWRIESAVMLIGPVQRMELYDHEGARWVRIDERTAPTEDARTVAVARDAPERFIDPDTLLVRARVGFHDPGVRVDRWWARIDEVFWLMR